MTDRGQAAEAGGTAERKEEGRGEVERTRGGKVASGGQSFGSRRVVAAVLSSSFAVQAARDRWESPSLDCESEGGKHTDTQLAQCESTADAASAAARVCVCVNVRARVDHT